MATVSELEAQLLSLEAARQQRLLGQTPKVASWGDVSTEFALASLADIDATIHRVNAELTRLRSVGAAASTPYAPIRVSPTKGWW